MPRSEMTREELVALFATKATAPPPEANKFFVTISNAKSRYVSPAPSGRPSTVRGQREQAALQRGGERPALAVREPVHGLPDGAGETYRLFALEMPHE